MRDGFWTSRTATPSKCFYKSCIYGWPSPRCRETSTWRTCFLGPVLPHKLIQHSPPMPLFATAWSLSPRPKPFGGVGLHSSAKFSLGWPRKRESGLRIVVPGMAFRTNLSHATHVSRRWIMLIISLHNVSMPVRPGIAALMF